MAVTDSGVYWLSMEKFLTLATGLTSWESTSCKYMMVLDTSTPDFDLDDFRADYTATEVSGTNYTAGGNALVSPAITISSGLKHDFDDPSWANSTISNAMAGIVTSGNATDTADEVYYLQDFVTAVSSSSGTFTVQINTAGALTMTAT